MLGISMALVLIVCLSANDWLIDRTNRENAAAQRTVQLKTVGAVLAQASQQLIISGDLPGLHRLVANCASTMRLATCRVSMGTVQIAAGAMPSRAPSFSAPERGGADASAENDIASLRFPFAVSGKGAGYIELGAAQTEEDSNSGSGTSALICAVGLCALVFVYRRSRHGLAEMEVVRSSLSTLHRGETSLAALQVDAQLGPAAVAWNKLLADFENLRRRTALSPAATPNGNRRAGGNTLDAACEAMSQGLILVDDKMRVRFSNGAACAFLKRDRNSLGGVAAADLIEDPKVREAMSAVAAGKLRRPVSIELEQPSDLGGGVLRFCIRPVRRGDADSAMIIIDDITQQRTAERSRNTFINQVTHELRTPLTNIRLYTETAIDGGEANPEVRANCLNVINQEARRLERIVSEMLSVAEIEAGCSTVHKDEVYFDVMMNDLKADYRAQADEKKVSLEFIVSPKLPKLSADKDKLAIAMHNLIGNALKYTPQGGKVTVSVEVRDGQLAIDVADTGIGIKPEETEKIFDRFFRSADPRVGKIVGTGLGLTLAREVMRLHGGDVTVQSEINRGSTFTATMPVTIAA
jgi:signal transduction histidine kinase